MQILDMKILEGRDFNTVFNFAEQLQIESLEGKINAHKIYSFLERIIKNDFSTSSYLRGIVKYKMWNLEKYFGWNPQYFSQAGQDKLIYEKFFKNLDKDGFFIDIGAYDGVTGSNTYFFEKHLDWKGILVEPAKGQFDKLKSNRNNKCINTAAAEKNETLEFIEVTEGYTQMSGLNQKDYNDTYDLLRSDLNSVTKKYNIQTSIFKDIVQEKKEIDYLSIDIEGGEFNLIKSIDFNFYKVKVISVENNKPNEISYKDYLFSHGFKFFDYCGNDEIYFNPNLISH